MANPPPNVEQAIALLNTGHTLVGFPDLALSALALVVDADLFTYNEVDLDTGEARFVLRPRRSSGDSFQPAGFLRRFGYHPAATSIVDLSRSDIGTVPRFVRDPHLRSVGVGNCCGEAEIKLNADLPLSKGSRLVGVTASCAVRAIADTEYDGLKAIQPHLAAALDRSLRSASRPAPPAASPRLTRRENEVLYWVSMGKTNEEIGVIIGARPLTVKKHLEHVYEKLDVPNRTAAAALVGRNPEAFQLVLPPAALPPAVT